LVDLAIFVPRDLFDTALNACRGLRDHLQSLVALRDHLRHADSRQRIADMVIKVANLFEPSLQASLKEEPDEDGKQSSLDDVYGNMLRKKRPVKTPSEVVDWHTDEDHKKTPEQRLFGETASVVMLEKCARQFGGVLGEGAIDRDDGVAYRSIHLSTPLAIIKILYPLRQESTTG
jgi:hypothetical protein